MTVQEPADTLRVPRAQAGASPQHLLATLLGEYLDSADASLPSTAVIAILREFGVSESSARAALSRLVKRGLIARRGTARPPVYHLTPQAIAKHRSRMRHFLNFGSRCTPWTGEWVMASFSIPNSGQAFRHAVRKAFGALNLVGLYDSVWIRPGSDVEPVKEALHDLLHHVEGARWSVLRVRFEDEAGPHGPASAYDLRDLAAAYSSFIQRYAALRADARGGAVDATRALVARTSAMDSWRRFADIDPDLPPHLLPQPWPRQEARDTFLDIHTALGSLAQARLVQLATPHWPDAASWITHFQASGNPSHPEPTGGTHGGSPRTG